MNSPAGLEQGFTLSQRTEGEGPLVLDLSLEGAEASWSGEVQCELRQRQVVSSPTDS